MTTSPAPERPRQPKVSRLLAAEIRAEMGRQAVSKRELSRRLHVSDLWVGRRLATKSTVQITLEEAVDMAEALDVSAERLLLTVLPRLDSNQQPSGYRSLQVAGRVLCGEPRPRPPVDEALAQVIDLDSRRAA